MTHSEFVAAYARGEVTVEMDPPGAARYLSAQLLLPFVTMPVAGAGVALALIGWVYAGLALIAVAFVVPRLIRRSAPRFLLQQALADAQLYEALLRGGILRVANRRPGMGDA